MSIRESVIKGQSGNATITVERKVPRGDVSVCSRTFHGFIDQTEGYVTRSVISTYHYRPLGSTPLMVMMVIDDENRAHYATQDTRCCIYCMLLSYD